MKFVAIFAWAAVTAVVSAFVMTVAALIAGVELSEEAYRKAKERKR